MASELFIETLSLPYSGNADTRDFTSFSRPIQEFTIVSLQSLIGLTSSSLSRALNFRPTINDHKYSVTIYLLMPSTGEPLIEPENFESLAGALRRRILDCSELSFGLNAAEDLKKQLCVEIDSSVQKLSYDEGSGILTAPSKAAFSIVEALLPTYSSMAKNVNNSEAETQHPVDLQIGAEETPVRLSIPPPARAPKRTPGQPFLIAGMLRDLLGSPRAVRIVSENQYTVRIRPHHRDVAVALWLRRVEAQVRPIEHTKNNQLEYELLEIKPEGGEQVEGDL